MNQSFFLSPFWIFLFLFGACQSEQNSMSSIVQNKFSDAKIRQIYDLADRRKTSDLLPFLSDSLPKYRLETAQVLASVQDTLALPKLLHLLSDENSEIRAMAAYAIGQIRDNSAQSKLIECLENELNIEVKIKLLEAIGKVADSVGMAYLTDQNYSTEPEKYGQVLGMYRALLRGESSPKSVETAVLFLELSESERINLKASEFLARNRFENYAEIIVPYPNNPQPVYEMIVRFLHQTNNPFTRMNLVRACRHTYDTIPSHYTDSLVNTLKFDKHELVRIACARTLVKSKNVAKYLQETLQDKSVNLRVAICQTLVQLDEKIDFQKLSQIENLGFREKAILTVGLLKNSTEPEKYSAQVIDNYRKSKNNYEKGLLLKALSEQIENFDFIAEELLKLENPVLITSAMEALLHIRNQEKFQKLEGNLLKFDKILRWAIGTKEPALGYFAGNELQNPARKYIERFPNFDFIQKTLDSLQLPQEQETYIALKQALDFLKMSKVEPIPTPKFNHPIDWEYVQKISTNQRIKITTSKGEIIWKLDVENAPATVASFLQLVDNQFYMDKTIHRIVPNFVVQGGCPRGDGFGSTTYSIRSEFAPLYYREGTVGMASAGKDTEGCQWFMTHIPTPRLDGNYTIFAQVIEGMDVVNQLEMGDKIEKIERL